MRSPSYWIGSPSLGNTVGVAEVEEVGVNQGDDILAEVGCLERNRRQGCRLPRALHEPAPVGHPLDPRHSSQRATSVSVRCTSGVIDGQPEAYVSPVTGGGAVVRCWQLSVVVAPTAVTMGISQTSLYWAYV